MFVDLLLSLLYGVLLVISAPLRLLPDVSAPAFFTGLAATTSSYLAVGRIWLPTFTDTMLLTWGVYLAVEVFIFVYKGIRWVYSKIPGIN